MEVLTAAFGGEEGSSLITDRNAAALDVLKEQIAKGRRKIAIFYGAAHMDDFDEKLRRDFQLQLRETVWLEAWDLPITVTWPIYWGGFGPFVPCLIWAVRVLSIPSSLSVGVLTITT
jgi:hypothetical protein